MESVKKEIRKLLMAGLGAAAEGVEKGDALLERLAEKGEDTLKQGKIKNEELKRSIRETISGGKETDELMKAVEKMSAGQLQALKEILEKREKEQEAESAEDAPGEEAEPEKKEDGKADESEE